MQVQCPRCNQNFEDEPGEMHFCPHCQLMFTRQPAAPPQPEAPASVVGKLCPYCQSEIGPSDQTHSCPVCATPHHLECWRENEGCTTYGCSESPQARALAGRTEPTAPRSPEAPPYPYPSDQRGDQWDRGSARGTRSQPAIPAAVRTIFYIMVLLLAFTGIGPLAGIVGGAILMGQRHPEDRAFGRSLLVYSLVILLFTCLCCGLPSLVGT